MGIPEVAVSDQGPGECLSLTPTAPDDSERAVGPTRKVTSRIGSVEVGHQFGTVKRRAHNVPTRTRNRAKYCELPKTIARPKLPDLTGLLPDTAGQPVEHVFPAFRPEKREVTGSTPVPTTCEFLTWACAARSLMVAGRMPHVRTT